MNIVHLKLIAAPRLLPGYESLSNAQIDIKFGVDIQKMSDFKCLVDGSGFKKNFLRSMSSLNIAKFKRKSDKKEQMNDSEYFEATKKYSKII